MATVDKMRHWGAEISEEEADLLVRYLSVPFSFGGTGLLIVVGVALDTVQQIESHLITRNYEGFAGPKGPRIRGRVPARPR